MYHSSPAARKASASSAALPPPPSSMELKSSPPKTTTIHPTWFSFRGNTTRDSPLHTHPNNERKLSSAKELQNIDCCNDRVVTQNCSKILKNIHAGGVLEVEHISSKIDSAT
ncbi:hypothetical protein Tco_0879625 [Tanacetum coccineum]